MQVAEKKIIINQRFHVMHFSDALPYMFLLDNNKKVMFRDAAVVRTLELLEGGCTFPRLYAQMASMIAPKKLAGLISQLFDAGILEFESDRTHSKSTRSFIDPLSSTAFNLLLRRQELEPAPAISRLSHFRAAVLSPIEADTDGLIQILRNTGIQVNHALHPISDIDLHILVIANYMSPNVSAMIRQIQSKHTPCLLFSPFGHSIHIGPLLDAKASCWSCIRKMLSFQDPLYNFLRNRQSTNETLTPRSGFCAPSLSFGYARLALDVIHYAIHKNHSLLSSHIVSLNVDRSEFSTHALSHLVKCPSCRKKSHGSSHPHLANMLGAPATHLSQIDKTAAFENASDLLAPLISPMTGIISAINPIPLPFSDGAIHLHAANYRLLHKYHSVSDLLMFGQRQSSALGRSRIEAHVKAGFEAIEHYSCAFQGYEKTQHLPYDSLEQAVHPNTLLNFSQHQYASKKAALSESTQGALYIPHCLDPTMPVHWSRAWNLTRNKPSLIPMAYSYYGFFKDARQIAVADSNGTAAGLNLAFCFQNGLYELIQRDAVAIWHYNMLNKPGVDVASWNDAYLNQLIGIHHKLGRHIEVLDIKTDLPLFVFAAVSIDDSSQSVIQGFGAHHEPDIALRKALEESCQMLPNVIPAEHPSFAPDSIYANRYNINSGQIKGGTIPKKSPAVMPVQLHHRGLFSHPLLKKNDFDPTWAVTNSTEWIHHLNACGIEVMVLDMQRPETRIPVLRVIAPGLRSWYPRFGPGRLYEVPVSLGLLPKAKQEPEMNPVPILF